MNAAEEAADDTQYNPSVAQFALSHDCPATADHGTAVAATEREQRSAGNVFAPRPTAHDEHDANAAAAAAGARKEWTKWRTQRWTRPWPKQ